MPRRRAARGSGGRAELPDGTPIVVRSLGEEDQELLITMFERLSERSRYRRFLTPKQRLSDRELAAFVDVDHRNREALVGLASNGAETGIGVARFVRSPEDPEAAEVAVAVADDWHRRGVGLVLLAQLADRARAEGIRRFSALVLAENRDVRALFERVGDVTVGSADEGQLELEITLPEGEGIGPGLARALKAAARREISLGEAGNVFRRAPEALRRRVRSIGAAPEPRRAGPIRTILAACDGSDGGETAARGAIALAGALGARVVVLGAYEPAADGGRRTVGRVLSSPGPDRGTVEAGLSRVADEVAGAGVEVSVDARPGEPAAAILDAAEESAADLIVVGDRGMRNRSRHLLGSVADRVSHHAPCSVLIVRS